MKNELPAEATAYEHMYPIHVTAIPFRKELADGHHCRCDGKNFSEDCDYYKGGLCDAPEDVSCNHWSKVYYLFHENHTDAIAYLREGDYIEYLQNGGRRAWRKEEFESRFRKRGVPMTFIEYDSLCDAPYYHYVPGLPDLCGWCIKDEDDYLDLRDENIAESYGRDFLAFRSKEDADEYVRLNGEKRL